ncbi:DNA-binding beta-propeller fold protein YncE [Anoxybacillus voinovskiensis]|uniref:DNA-binding beta-propeller fold protein YncE n=1 Tax=Anoxybacteroides voinovskiense TaxID=230470 RepID=A0A840DQ47_9BACL|nr:hypothetical protein [Anoxybacillus voinovskiensis]MBB4075271.1 DNA-binding beta-propeller fold protein YncE [Anoxybacillus voinovskiensis]GGJ77614.1 hypothetical protein GCM10008982_28760 [Anoxybacillus voinovskiensis]
MRRFILFLCLLLASCQHQAFPPIPRQMETLISVNIKDGTVTFFDLTREKKYTQWEIREPVKGGVLLKHGQELLLYGNELEQVYVYDLATGKRKSEWNTGKGIVSALVSSDGKQVFLADEQQQKLRIFTVEGKEEAAIRVGKKPLTLLQTKDGKVYVIDFHDAKADIIDVRKRRMVATFSVPKSALGGLVREKELWVGGHGSGSTVETNIHVYSLDGKLKKTIAAPAMPISFVETDNGIFTLSHGSNTVRKWDKTGTKAVSLTVGVNPFTMIGGNKYLYIASYDGDVIDVVDQQTLRSVRQYKTGKGPFQLLIREGR